MRKLFGLIILLAGTSAFSQKAETILKNYGKAIGKENLKNIESILEKGKINQMGQTLDYETYNNRNGDSYMVLNVSGMKLTVFAIKNGKGFKMNQQMGYDELEKENIRKMQEQTQKLFDPASLINLDSVKTSGKQEYEGKMYDFIELENGTRYYFDRDTHLLKYIVKNDENGTMVTEIIEYKKINGVLFPSKTETKINGETIVTKTVDEIIVNSKDIDPSVFEMPE
jgi:hypothetical protein